MDLLVVGFGKLVLLLVFAFDGTASHVLRSLCLASLLGDPEVDLQ